MQWATDYHKEAKTRFLDGLKRVPSWGPEVDQQVQQYLNGLGNWARGNDCWSFEGGRYFGNKGLEYQKTRIVSLLAKVKSIDGKSLTHENTVVYHVEELYS